MIDKMLVTRSGFAALCAVLMLMTVSAQHSVARETILAPAHPPLLMPDAGGRVLGFTTRVQLADEPSAGYVPARIEFRAVAALAADRRLVYRFETVPGGQSPPRNGLTIDVPVVVSQGTTVESFVRYLPKWSAGQTVRVSVLEAGRELPDYTGVIANSLPTGRRANRKLLSTEYQINWVYIHWEEQVARKTKAALGGLLTAANPGFGSWPLTEAEAEQFWAGATAGPDLLAINPAQAPEDWREYQRYDVVAIGTRGIDKLKSSQPAIDALRGWVLNGGMLIVFGAESPESALEQIEFRWLDSVKSAAAVQLSAKRKIEDFEEAEEALTQGVASLERWIEEQLNREPIAGGESNADGEPGVDGDNTDFAAAVPVREPVFAEYDRFFQGDLVAAGESLAAQKRRLARTTELTARSVSEWADEIWMQAAGAGQVIVMRKDGDRDVPSLIHWNIARDMVGHRRSPMLRRGVDPLLGDRRFLRWLIPGVAQPPVYTFMGLLTAFVVLVGPIAYRRTTRRGRGYLMFAIAPVLALFTTLAMFGYGILSDGFGTVVRARQMTFVDGKSGDAGERVRTTYFAGIRPSEGIRFAGDAEVIAYPEGRGLSWSDLNKLSPLTIGRVVVTESTQQFDSSFLPSRQQRQFVVHAPRHDVGFLQLAPADDQKSPPTIENGFDFLIREAVVRDSSGEYWMVKDLPGGEKRICTPLSLKDSSRELGRIYNEHRPISSVRESRRRQRNYSNEIFDVIVDVNREISSSSTITDGSFELWLRDQLQTSGEIPADHFVATADVSQDVLSVAECELSASVRYVFGTLR